MNGFLKELNQSPVIATARDYSQVDAAIRSRARAVFILCGTILTLGEQVRRVRMSGKRVFVHLDLLGGLGRDATAVEWCYEAARPDGVISTRSPLLKRARELNMTTIQRLFVMDSASVEHGVRQFKSYAPDMLEVLPGLVPKAITFLSETLDIPIIAGGMITRPEEIKTALDAGAVGVSTSNEALWETEADACR
ncbi:MAG: glycerol-3-phosphate responsive antiterminator [Clostridia bacterium]|nr:glycerol-3-phosphate responsive antiterminator [Clostridia bacterium]